MNKGKLIPIFQKYCVVSAYLFGSQASGKTHKKSDTDIAVRFRKELSLKKTLQFANELTLFFKNECDVVDLDAAPLPLQFRIFRERKLLYAKNPKKEILEQAKAMCLYFDYKYYYDRFMKTEMNRIAIQGLTCKRSGSVH